MPSSSIAVRLTINSPTTLTRGYFGLTTSAAQRAHANFTENLLPALGALLISGLRFPTVAAGLGAGWAVSRVVYAAGYTSSGPKGRTRHVASDLQFHSLVIG